jgi:hypothetical protein
MPISNRAKKALTEQIHDLIDLANCNEMYDSADYIEDLVQQRDEAMMDNGLWRSKVYRLEAEIMKLRDLISAFKFRWENGK